MTKTLRVIFILSMLAQTVIWIVFGIIFLIDKSKPDIILPLLMFANSIAFAVFCWLFIKKGAFLRLLSLAFIFVNLVLTVTDQMGIYDFIVLALNIIAAGCGIALIVQGRKQPE